MLYHFLPFILSSGRSAVIWMFVLMYKLWVFFCCFQNFIFITGFEQSNCFATQCCFLGFGCLRYIKLLGDMVLQFFVKLETFQNIVSFFFFYFNSLSLRDSNTYVFDRLKFSHRILCSFKIIFFCLYFKFTNLFF